MFLNKVSTKKKMVDKIKKYNSAIHEFYTLKKRL